VRYVLDVRSRPIAGDEPDDDGVDEDEIDALD
jgi:hypothetical protein